jgi:hypothetical protein
VWHPDGFVTTADQGTVKLRLVGGAVRVLGRERIQTPAPGVAPGAMEIDFAWEVTAGKPSLHAEQDQRDLTGATSDRPILLVRSFAYSPKMSRSPALLNGKGP